MATKKKPTVAGTKGGHSNSLPSVANGVGLPRGGGPKAIATGGRRTSPLRHPSPLPFSTTSIPIGWCAVVSPDGVVLARLGPDPTLPTAGYGGWDSVERAKRKSLTNFVGVDPLAMPLTLLIDAYALDLSIEKIRDAVEAMALPIGAPGHLSEGFIYPPLVRAYGPGIPHTDIEWVVSNLTWLDDPVPQYTSRGELARVAVTLDLLEFVDGGDLNVSKVKRTKKKTVVCAKVKPAKRTHVVTKFEARHDNPLMVISARYFGATKCWKTLATLNKIRDPKAVKKMAGKTIKLR